MSVVYSETYNRLISFQCKKPLAPQTDFVKVGAGLSGFILCKLKNGMLCLF